MIRLRDLESLARRGGVIQKARYTVNDVLDSGKFVLRESCVVRTGEKVGGNGAGADDVDSDVFPAQDTAKAASETDDAVF